MVLVSEKKIILTWRKTLCPTLVRYRTKVGQSGTKWDKKWDKVGQKVGEIKNILKYFKIVLNEFLEC